MFGTREVPPTAGLPPAARDIVGGGDLAAGLSAFLGVERVGVECSGTAALVLLLAAMRRRSGRETVIVPGYTCPLVVRAIAAAGLRALPCDLAPDSFEFDLAALERICDARTLALIPTHLGGRVAEVSPLLALARERGACVIEDAAQALGARADGASVGLQGDAGFFSLAAGKGLTTFEGGAWLARDAALVKEADAARRRLVRRRPLLEAWRSLQLLGYGMLYRPRGLALAYGNSLRRALARGDDLAACGDRFGAEVPLHPLGAWRQRVAARALGRLPTFQAARARQARARLPALAALPGVKVFDDRAGAAGTWPVLMLLMPDAASATRALARLWGAGLGVGRMFARALGDYEDLRPLLAPAALPRARDFAARALTVSNSPWLDDAGFERIVRELRASLAPQGASQRSSQSSNV